MALVPWMSAEQAREAAGRVLGCVAAGKAVRRALGVFVDLAAAQPACRDSLAWGEVVQWCRLHGPEVVCPVAVKLAQSSADEAQLLREGLYREFVGLSETLGQEVTLRGLFRGLVPAPEKHALLAACKELVEMDGHWVRRVRLPPPGAAASAAVQALAVELGRAAGGEEPWPAAVLLEVWAGLGAGLPALSA